MTEEYTIPLSRIIKELSLREVHMPKTAEEILIVSRDVIRPGLELYGFCDYFDPKRITVLGRSEMAMLESLGEKKKAEAIDHFFALRPATVIVARDIDQRGGGLGLPAQRGAGPPHHPPRRAHRGLRRGHLAGGRQRRG